MKNSEPVFWQIHFEFSGTLRYQSLLITGADYIYNHLLIDLIRCFLFPRERE